MSAKQPHPALHFSRARQHSIRLQGKNVAVWMAPDIDELLNDFIATSESDAGLKNDSQRCPFGAVLWPSARALWEWLAESDARWEQVARAPQDATVRAIELGSGVGFLSALLGARTQWNLTASDYEPAYEDYLNANCILQKSTHIPFVTLDWLQSPPKALRQQFDLVIACDVFYDNDHLKSVPRIACELLKPNGTLLLADPERFRFTSALDALAKKFQKVEIYSTSVENSREDSHLRGVVNPFIEQTVVQIVHCQNPLS
jgi:predicted nicotinamide N-methyase